MTALQVVFWLSLLALLHSYVLFPAIMRLLSRGRRPNRHTYSPDSPELPTVSILLATYNEEKVIAHKLESTLATDYPLGKIEFLIGSDASTDATDRTIEEWRQRYPDNIKLMRFRGRTGKADIINTLAKEAKGEVFVLTDANVFFRPDTLYQLVKHYANPQIGLVGGNILNLRFKKDGISIQERGYLMRENLIKYDEGVVFGTMIGAFGGCYSVRAKYYAPVPPRFFMDDFYITLNVLERGKHTINELEAACYEDVSNKIAEEFRRKIRISIGNFQNLGRYWRLLFPPWTGLTFCFWSHKVLRWFGPFFLLAMLVATGLLGLYSLWWRGLFLLQCVLLLVPAIDGLLKHMAVHLPMLRYISHFYLMNLALLTGFLRYVRGVKSNIWRPTERNQ